MKSPLTDKVRTDIAPAFYSIAEACLILRSGKTRIYELINSGELTGVKDGTSTKVTADSIQRRVQKLIESSAKVAPAPAAAELSA